MRTPATTIRPLCESDFAGFCKLNTNSQVRQFLGGLRAQDQLRAAFADRLSQTSELHFTIIDIASTEMIGLVSVAQYHEAGQFELSYQLLPAYWGCGIAYRSSTEIFRYALKKGIETVVAETQVANQRSRRLLERLGMEESGSLVRFGADQAVYKLSLTLQSRRKATGLKPPSDP